MPEVPPSDEVAFAALEDPDGPLVAQVLSRLIQEPDRVARFAAATALIAGRANWVRQLTVHQYLAEGLSLADVAGTLGVSKARVAQLARGGRDRGPVNAYGRLIAAYGLVAEAAGEPARAEHDKLFPAASRSTLLRPRLHQAYMGWLTRLRRAGSGPETDERVRALAARVEELVAEAAGAPAGYLSLDEQLEVMLGDGAEHTLWSRLDSGDGRMAGGA